MDEHEKLLADLRGAAVELYRLLGTSLEELPLSAERRAALERAIEAEEGDVAIPTLSDWLASKDTRAMYLPARDALVNVFGNMPLTLFVTMQGHMLLKDGRLESFEDADLSALRRLLGTVDLHLGMSEDDAKAAFRAAQKH